MRYRDYFDAAGNQKALLPGEFIGSDFVPGRDDEPDISYIFKRVGTGDPSKVKIVQDYFEALQTHNDLVDNLERYVDRYNNYKPGHDAAEKKLDDFDEKTWKPAKEKLFALIVPIIEKLFPELPKYDEKRASITKYLKAVDGHTILRYKTYKPGTWTPYLVLIRDDGIVLPEFNKIFKSEEECTSAFSAFRKAAEAKKANGNANESETKKSLKEAAEYDVPETIKSFNGTFVVAGTRKGAVDGMPSNLQLRAFKKYENFKQWIDTMKFDVFSPKNFFEELAEAGEGRFSVDQFFFVVKLDGKCKDYYVD